MNSGAWFQGCAQVRLQDKVSVQVSLAPGSVPDVSPGVLISRFSPPFLQAFMCKTEAERLKLCDHNTLLRSFMSLMTRSPCEWQ